MMPDPAGGLPPPRDLPQALALLARREQELAALRASQEDWTRALSHDLRAPLRHITSYAPLLRETLHAAGLQGPDAQDAEQFLGVMEQGARRMGCMLDGVLELARMQRARPQLQSVDLAQLAGQAWAALMAAEPAAAQAQWQLPASPVPLQADPQLLRPLLAALLDNAFKFSRGRPLPRIRLEAEALPGGGLRWQVEDNGVGCDGTRAHQAFGLFQRLHRESEFDGVGVGLALAQTAAHQQGADIALHSAPGQGCRVELRWPAPAPA
ncbi:sensor histidine kinase [Comamonas endophytica]|uniref:histidine kinase n=1 Tax=Comamonas endophytica TaxID=2949090 RepID=A0ABY6GEC5_9BURK|nr:MULTISPECIES: HAMP domain-containing sensor histidine kinase [unclassified Acidovorax]MCD2512817.1 HAMP domain-containing histidine kinase [Acidovorax sp. D4N7]UYG52834.1 HAMP domain-containing histidine kinase [Acidovorax sp. 5MLIR]